MSPASFRPAFWMAVMLFSLPWLPVESRAHVGSPHIIFEGRAGDYPVRVIIRQPEVVPGLAEIHVRALGAVPERVTALPMHSVAGRKGAPRPDVATLVEGETHLFQAQLWFMTRGAYGVEVTTEGPLGGGSVMVPVNSMAYGRKEMPLWLLTITLSLLTLLGLGVVGITRAGFREASLPPDAPATPSLQRRGLIGASLGAVLVAGAIYGGNLWREVEDNQHKSRVLYRPFAHEVALAESDPPELTFKLTDSRASARHNTLLPDHGKLVHLFLVSDTSPPAFAHLHPKGFDRLAFKSTIPPLPGGNYRVFTDLVHEGGATQLLTNRLVLPSDVPVSPPSDPEDSWLASRPVGERTSELGEGMTMQLEVVPGASVSEGVSLRASVRNPEGGAVTLEPYLRMLGHAVVMKEDGGRFAHLHPAGTLNMAAARRMADRSGPPGAAEASDAVCGDLSVLPPEQALAMGREGVVSFPFVFPEMGNYWIWVQVRVKGVIRTGLFRHKA